MKEAFARVKKILSGNSLAPQLGHVCLLNGKLYATDGRLFVCVPCDGEWAEPTVIPANQLERALKYDALQVHSRNDTEIVFKSGRSRIKISLLDPVLYPLGECPEQLQTFPPQFLSALAQARKFISDNASQPWAMSALVTDREIIACNNVVLAAVDYPDPPLKGMVPGWLIDFILSQEVCPTACRIDPAYLYFAWEDGMWVRSVCIAGQYPEAALHMASQAREAQCTWLIPEDWREEYRKALTFSDSQIIVGPGHMTAGSATAQVVTDIETPVDKDTIWDPRFLDPVLECATHWDIQNWPRSMFKGDGIRGLIAGKAVAT